VGAAIDPPELLELPEILVLWNRDAPNIAVGSPKIGEIRRPYSGNRTGDHKATSIVLVRPSERLSLAISGISEAGVEGCSSQMTHSLVVQSEVEISLSPDLMAVGQV
jgi:hypothetical protein